MGEDLGLSGRLDVVLDELAAIATSYGIDVLAGIALLIAGWIAARWASSAVGRSLKRARHCSPCVPSGSTTYQPTWTRIRNRYLGADAAE